MRPLTILAVLVVVGAIAALSLLPLRAEARPPLVELSSGLPAVPGPLNVLASCGVAIDSNPDGGTDLVKCASGGVGGYVEIFCENRTDRPVYYGGASSSAVLNGTAPCISADSDVCKRDAFRFSVRPGALGASIADGGTVTLNCIEGR